MRRAGRILVDGEAAGTVCRLRAPISFWGGVDARTGIVTQPRHPDHGRSVCDTVLVLPGTVGSSSSSAVMLELIHLGRAPAAVILAEADAILALGAIVAREMGLRSVPMLEMPIHGIEDGAAAQVLRGGDLRWSD